MPERYAWPEGQLLVWTGTSNPVTAAYVENVRGSHAWGWYNIGPSIGGTYTDHLTGQRADVSVGVAYTYDTTLVKMAQSATAVHIQLNHSGVNGSAGWKYYSGRLVAQTVEAYEGGLYSLTLQYYANNWTAYGG